MHSIETTRLILRDFELADVTLYCALVADPKYQCFYSEDDCSVERSVSLVNAFIDQAGQPNRRQFQMAIELKSSQQLIGTAGLRLEPDSQASIGCGVGRQYQSCGYALEAMAALLRYGFEHHGVHRVYAETISENKPAIRLCGKLGMREEAHFRENRYFKGKWWSTVVMAVLKSEWMQNDKCL